MQRALVTGGAGFIGSHLVDRLMKTYDVSIIDNLSTGNQSCVPKNVRLYIEDIRKQKNIQILIKNIQPDIVFHIAGQASNIQSFTNPHFDLEVNFQGTVNVVLASVEAKVKRFLYASSMTVYGHPATLPVSEKEPCLPVSYYGISKYAAERFVLATGARTDLPSPMYTTSLRMFNVYGPRQSLTNPYQGPVAIFLGHVLRGEPITIFGDGKQTRDFVYIDDVISAWTATIKRKITYQNAYNIGFGKAYTIYEIAKTVIAAAGKDPQTYPILYKPTLPGEQRDMLSHIGKISRDVSFRPTVHFDNGLAKTIAWARTTV